MADDVAADGLLRIDGVGHAAARIGSDLVAHVDGDIELLAHLLHLAEEAGEELLPLGELAASREVDAERRHDRVDDEQSVGVLDHVSGAVHQKRVHGVDGEGAADHDVGEDLLGVKLEAARDGLDALRPERVLGVDIEDLAGTAALLPWQLCRDAESVRELRLAGTELSERFSDGLRLDAAQKQSVPHRTAGRDPLDLLASLEDLDAAAEALLLDLARGLEDLLRLRLSDAANVHHFLLRAAKVRIETGYLHHEAAQRRAHARRLQLEDVAAVDAVVLQLVDLVEGLLLLDLHRRLRVGLFDLFLLGLAFLLLCLHSGREL